ncbi:MAG: zinc ribbon domain-containing protein [Desulfovibrionaceae bacterium]|nr:zinc ribbon domain-containing protein [Desulfovibrionaceae bacterium]
MITCTKCGEKNSDDTRFCTRCGWKLQSSQRGHPAGEIPADRPLTPFRHQGMPADVQRDLKRLIEASAYAVILAGVAVACWWQHLWWPLYPTVGALALLVFFRRL